VISAKSHEPNNAEFNLEIPNNKKYSNYPIDSLFLEMPTRSTSKEYQKCPENHQLGPCILLEKDREGYVNTNCFYGVQKDNKNHLKSVVGTPDEILFDSLKFREGFTKFKAWTKKLKIPAEFIFRLDLALDLRLHCLNFSEIDEQAWIDKYEYLIHTVSKFGMLDVKEKFLKINKSTGHYLLVDPILNKIVEKMTCIEPSNMNAQNLALLKQIGSLINFDNNLLESEIELEMDCLNTEGRRKNRHSVSAFQTRSLDNLESTAETTKKIRKSRRAAKKLREEILKKNCEKKERFQKLLDHSQIALHSEWEFINSLGFDFKSVSPIVKISRNFQWKRLWDFKIRSQGNFLVLIKRNNQKFGMVSWAGKEPAHYPGKNRVFSIDQNQEFLENSRFPTNTTTLTKFFGGYQAMVANCDLAAREPIFEISLLISHGNQKHHRPIFKLSFSFPLSKSRRKPLFDKIMQIIPRGVSRPNSKNF